MLSVVKVAKHFAQRVLFENATHNLVAPGRYGVVGANGAGKSTYLKILAGLEELSDGEILTTSNLEIGYLRQDQFFDTDLKILDTAMRGQEALFDAMEELEALTGEGGAKDPHRISELNEIIVSKEGYKLPSLAATILEGLGIESQFHQDSLHTLSGGFRWRVILAQLLVKNPDVLLLDEPTNHLDMLAIRWLEKYLSGFSGTVVLVSHDRRFLDNVCNHYLDFDYSTIKLYKGNFAAFAEAKSLKEVQTTAQYEAAKKEIAHKQAYVDRFRYKASKAKQAQSRLKQIEKIDTPDLLRSSRQKPNFAFSALEKSSQDVLELDNVSKSFGDKSVLSGINLRLRREDKVGIIGANGVGKSTLLKIAVSQLAADDGKIEWGHKTSLGYLAQDLEEAIRSFDGTLLQWLKQFDLVVSETKLRSLLGQVLFSKDDVAKDTTYLSGGECVRLHLAKIMLQKPNVLVLDEPTNHLDLEAIDALVTALNNFDGTLVFVSHDRYFVSSIATRIVEIKPEGISDFMGSFGEYLSKCGDDHLDVTKLTLVKKAQKQALKSQEPTGQNNYQLSKEKKSEERKKKARVALLLTEIEQCEEEIKDIENKFLDPDLYKSKSSLDVSKLKDTSELAKRKLEDLYDRWSLADE